MNTQRMALDISKRTETPPVLTIRQGDRNGTRLEAEISDNGTSLDLAGKGVRLCAKLPDGAHYYSANGTAQGNIATFQIDEAYAGAYVGTGTAYVEVLEGQDVICSTHSLILEVEPCARDGAEPGEQYISEIDAEIERVEEIIGQIEEGAVFGVKGNAEESYRVGMVNLTPANIGASPEGHGHAIADVSGLQDALDSKLEDADISVTQTETGADITINGDTVSLLNGEPGPQGPQGPPGSSGAGGVMYSQVDASSTSTAFTASVPGVTELTHGLCIVLKNGVVTSASGFTLNVNNLGAKPVYTNLAAATRETTKFNVNYTMMFIYDEYRVEGGCWVCYNGYDSNDNTIGYRLRTNASALTVADKTYRYRLLFTSADGSRWVPANTSSSTSASTQKQPNTRPIDPFGPIAYYSATAEVDAVASPAASSIWQQYPFALGYSFNATGAALSLANPAPVYIVCTPLADGSATLDGYAQTLPSTDDGRIYILLGIAYDATHVEMVAHHPVYWYSGGAIRQWTNGGGGGTGDYADLTGKPSIEGVTLQGDKTFPDLGIFIDAGEEYPQSDEYALETLEIDAIWNLAMA